MVCSLPVRVDVACSLPPLLSVSEQPQGIVELKPGRQTRDAMAPS